MRPDNFDSKGRAKDALNIGQGVTMRKQKKRDTASVTRLRKNHELAQKQERAIQLRLAGATWTKIAETLGYSSAAKAQELANRAIDRMGVEPTERLIKIELARLDVMQQVAWNAMLQGDLSAIDIIMRIMDKRAKYAGVDRVLFNGANTGGNVTVNVNGVDGGTAAALGKLGVLIVSGEENTFLSSVAAATGVDAPVFNWAADNIVEGEVVEDTQPAQLPPGQTT